MENKQRTFILGDEWLYYKIYSGPKTSDELLSEVIKPISESLLAENLIDKWFFIRYSDPKLHIRVRFHYTKLENIYFVTKLMNGKLKPYIEENLVWKIQVDTYNRELERYGENTIELAEDLFYFDSSMIVNMIDMIEGDEGEIIRWLFATRVVDSFLDDFKYSPEQKYEFTNIMQSNFGKEFNMNKQLGVQLDNKFRTERDAINDVLNRAKDEESEMLPLFDLIKNKSENIKPIINKIFELKENEQLQVDITNLLSSFIHMTVNRIFKSKQRLHEFVIYYLLCKYYKSEIAINKARKNIEQNQQNLV